MDQTHYEQQLPHAFGRVRGVWSHGQSALDVGEMVSVFFWLCFVFVFAELLGFLSKQACASWPSLVHTTRLYHSYIHTQLPAPRKLADALGARFILLCR